MPTLTSSALCADGFNAPQHSASLLRPRVAVSLNHDALANAIANGLKTQSSVFHSRIACNPNLPLFYTLAPVHATPHQWRVAIAKLKFYARFCLIVGVTDEHKAREANLSRDTEQTGISFGLSTAATRDPKILGCGWYAALFSVMSCGRKSRPFLKDACIYTPREDANGSIALN
jgi:hypothetical protein